MIKKREVWEVRISCFLQNAAWYLDFLFMSKEDRKTKALAAVYGVKDIHVWAMNAINWNVSHVDRPGARVNVPQEKLDILNKLTGVEAVEYKEE